MRRRDTWLPRATVLLFGLAVLVFAGAFWGQQWLSYEFLDRDRATTEKAGEARPSVPTDAHREQAWRVLFALGSVGFVATVYLPLRSAAREAAVQRDSEAFDAALEQARADGLIRQGDVARLVRLAARPNAPDYQLASAAHELSALVMRAEVRAGDSVAPLDGADGEDAGDGSLDGDSDPMPNGGLGAKGAAANDKSVGSGFVGSRSAAVALAALLETPDLAAELDLEGVRVADLRVPHFGRVKRGRLRHRVARLGALIRRQLPKVRGGSRTTEGQQGLRVVGSYFADVVFADIAFVPCTFISTEFIRCEFRRCDLSQVVFGTGVVVSVADFASSVMPITVPADDAVFAEVSPDRAARLLGGEPRTVRTPARPLTEADGGQRRMLDGA